MMVINESDIENDRIIEDSSIHDRSEECESVEHDERNCGLVMNVNETVLDVFLR